ncbi:MAG TPA: hypothetical protein VII30_00955, partial [Gemmatimonadaceae bacterium]
SGDQLIATGRVVPDDTAQFRTLVEAHPNIKTVVLWNSPGGAGSANDAITLMIEERHLDTVVAGYCVSACAMIFLSGTNRAFGDLEPLASTSLGFHGSYVRGELAPDRRLKALEARVLERTGNKIDPALVERWLHLTDERNTIRFRYPGEGAAPATFFCPLGRFPNAGNYTNCEAIPKTDALTAGIITSTTIVHVNR